MTGTLHYSQILFIKKSLIRLCQIRDQALFYFSNKIKALIIRFQNGLWANIDLLMLL
jgi:hypothetical protein